MAEIALKELVTVEDFFAEKLDLICRFVGATIAIKVNAKTCKMAFIPDDELLENYLIKALIPLRDALYLDGGRLSINVHSFLYMGLAIYCLAYSQVDLQPVCGTKLLISREIAMLTPLTQQSRSGMIIVSR